MVCKSLLAFSKLFPRISSTSRFPKATNPKAGAGRSEYVDNTNFPKFGSPLVDKISIRANQAGELMQIWISLIWRPILVVTHLNRVISVWNSD